MGLLRFKKTIIGFAIVAGIVLAGVIAIQYIRPYFVADYSSCINNLVQIDGAKATWALENHITNNVIVTWQEIQPYCGRGPNGALPLPKCPEGGTYTLGRLNEAPKCSIPGHTLE